MSDCKGTTHTLNVNAGRYESPWWLDGGKNAKADSIEDLMKQLGVTGKLCELGCTGEDEGKTCRPHSLHASDEAGGGADSDMAVADVELHKKKHHKYVLDVQKAGKITFTTGCLCMASND